MAVKVSHLAAAFVGILVLVGAAFSFGMQWNGEAGDGAEAAAAASALEQSGATTTDEVIEAEGDPAPESYSVVRVVDGDTIAISMNGKTETVRLIGIDTPETVDPRVAVQCFGKEASNKMKALLDGRSVRLEMDEGEGERDKYKRLLAYVFRDDGLFVNKYLIEQGFAYEYTYDSAYKYQKEFKAAEAAAEGSERGLWAPNACPPAQPAVKGAAQKKEEAAPAAEPPAPAAQQEPESQPQSQSEPQTPPQNEPEPELEPEPAPAPSGSYTCSSNKYNCSDFSTHAEAQAVFDMCGGADNDVHKLDNNKDGEACESLP